MNSRESYNNSKKSERIRKGSEILRENMREFGQISKESHKFCNNPKETERIREIAIGTETIRKELEKNPTKFREHQKDS